jgi:hypothetical protein
MEGTIKLTVTVPHESVEGLREYASGHGTTMTEALRRALGVQDFLGKHVSAGGKVLIERRNGKLLRVLGL